MTEQNLNDLIKGLEFENFPSCTGDIQYKSFLNKCPPTWIELSPEGPSKIGNSVSCADLCQGKICKDLYSLVWNQCVFESKGSSAEADWVANKPIDLLKAFKPLMILDFSKPEDLSTIFIKL